jgi:hypothetical protein
MSQVIDDSTFLTSGDSSDSHLSEICKLDKLFITVLLKGNRKDYLILKDIRKFQLNLRFCIFLSGIRTHVSGPLNALNIFKEHGHVCL